MRSVSIRLLVDIKAGMHPWIPIVPLKASETIAAKANP